MATNFWESNHKWTYITIGLINFTNPKRVFDLAHGNAHFEERDENIMHALYEQGIVHRRHAAR